MGVDLVALGEELVIKVKLGFLLTAGAAIVFVTGFAITLRMDVTSLLQKTAAQQVMIDNMQNTLTETNINVRLLIKESERLRNR